MDIRNAIVSGLSKVTETVDKNSPAILATIGIAGFITTVVIACKATPRATAILEEADMELDYISTIADDKGMSEEEQKSKVKEIKLDCAKKLAKTYAPSAGMAVFSTVCIIGSYSLHAKRLAAVATAYNISETAFNEYRAHVRNSIGKNKEKQVRNDISQDQLNAHPIEKSVVYETGRGNTLIFEPLTGRYYHGNIDDMYKAESTINKRLFGEFTALLNEFFDEMGFNDNAPRSELADDVGFNTEHMMDMDIGSGIATNGEPCIVMQYLNRPSAFYI